MKKIFFIAQVIFLLLSTSFSFAQGSYEWVRGYSSSIQYPIRGAVGDNDGNMYILGMFNTYDTWDDGTLIRPSEMTSMPYQGQGVVVAKFSPEGDLVWKKVIANDFIASYAYDLQLVGDSAIAFLVEFGAYYDSSEFNRVKLYYLDTLFYSYNENRPPVYPMRGNFRTFMSTSLIMLDFDGNLLEHHFLRLTYLDNNGDDIFFNPDVYYTTCFYEPTFSIDDDGYIYISRNITDHATAVDMDSGALVFYNVSDGSLGAVKIWCDMRQVGVVPLDRKTDYTPQILKFSPHFDTLVGYRDVYQTTDPPFVNAYLKAIPQDRFCLTLNMYSTPSQEVFIDSAQNMSFSLNNDIFTKEISILYDTALNPLKFINFEELVTATSNITQTSVFSSLIQNVMVDEEYNRLIVTCALLEGRVWNPTETRDSSFFVIDGVPLQFRSNVGVLIFDNTTYELKNYSNLTAQNFSEYNGLRVGAAHLGATCKNGRIFTQFRSFGDLYLPNDTIVSPGTQYVPWTSVAVFDYNGNLLEILDQRVYGHDQYEGPVVLHGSDLYQILYIQECDATFGDISVPNYGNGFACIVKYTDKDFLDPYPYDPVGGIAEADQAGKLSVFPNPTIGRVVVALSPYEPITEAYVVTLTGIRHRVPVSGNSIDLADFPSGILFLQLVTPHHTYTQKVVKTR